MENVIVLAVLAVIVGAVVWYLVRAKKRGEACVGCPYAKGCGGCCSHGKTADQANEKDLE